MPDEVRDIVLSEAISADDMIRQMYDAGGFSAKPLAIGVGILEEMVRDKDCLTFLSFPANLVATGTRGVLRELVKRRWVDAVITTCGTLDHDIARTFKPYYHGDFCMDDGKLRKRGINRLGNVLVPNASYGPIVEEKVGEMLQERGDWEGGRIGTKELCWEIGKRLDERSILYWSAHNHIPVYVPGITDGAVGSQLWIWSQEHDFQIDVLADERELADLVFGAKRSGALILGGGISKHHVIWWNQFKDGLDYAVYVTTAVEWDGSLSGARLREAVSWGKVKANARYVTIPGDVTVLLPLMVAAMLDRLSGKKV